MNDWKPSSIGSLNNPNINSVAVCSTCGEEKTWARMETDAGKLTRAICAECLDLWQRAQGKK